jgi:two-component system sensor kinase FixL
MGLGLSIARSIIETHRGRIWAENNATQGATFHFTVRTADFPGFQPSAVIHSQRE